MSPSNPPALHRASALARLQQGMALSSLVCAGLWLRWWWRDAPTLAVVGAAAIVMGYALVLALQFALMARVNRQDTVPPLRPGELLRAWWAEVRVAPRVFSWRQPFRWHALPDADVPPAPGRVAVVLVHGFVCNRGLWLPWMRALRQRGLPYTSVNLEPVFGSIDGYVPLIDDAVRRAQALTGRPPLLVCHSMGGLAARAWLAATPGAADRVCGVVTIGTPHQGTWLAHLSHTANGRQMRIDGAWLQALRAREAGRARPPFVCWYSNADNIVFPATTATLAGADNRLLPGVPHVAMAFHPRVMGESLAMLASAGSSPSERTAA
ncbi:alpha/beta fold hydrolase [Hydrogenophaga sp.]|uniref:esterase/lipase family protein n=1 Tax=Hydrogenophaga sp. TaxID=1904254 RepID=UPI00286E2E28|nr:alpha/beta fold hydrolase [Hydrogenophaga sp.]